MDESSAVACCGHFLWLPLDYFWDKIENIDVEDMWFQQGGATCYT